MNRFIIKLKQWLHYNNFKGNFHFTIIVIILAFLFITTGEIEKIFIGCLMLGLLIYIFIKHRHLFFLSAIITFSIISIYFIKVLLYDNAKEKINQNLIVKEVEEEETYHKVILSNGYYKYIYYNKNKLDINIKIGDIYYIKGIVKRQKNESVPHGFDYASYLKYQNIIGIIEIDEIDLEFLDDFINIVIFFFCIWSNLDFGN